MLVARMNARSKVPSQALAHEAQAVSERKPQERAYSGAGHTLRHGGEDVLLADHSAIEQRQSWYGHHQDERACGHHPRGIGGIDLRRGSLREGRRRRERETQCGADCGAHGDDCGFSFHDVPLDLL
jgi:hypothetical protein